ncbi:MAG TPA: hypothetical protein DCG57_02960 [Candidatus Riflebacteria bacterium]|nr:hypothetical protein [Candidatus Riflebacteria bacterium]
MQCKEFRSLMKEGGGIESELEQHLGSCHECSTWLEHEIAEPPMGLTPAQWQTATARCFPENLPETAAEAPAEKTEPVTFWKSYVNGMTYGLVFGLSIVFGFAILQLLPDAGEKTLERSLAQINFVEGAARELPVFFAEKKFDVTFLANDDSEIMSFVEFDNEIKFLDYSEEENL